MTWAASRETPRASTILHAHALAAAIAARGDAAAAALLGTQDDNALFTADLSNPDLLEDGQIALRRENIHLNRMKFIWNGACYERLVVNFSDCPLSCA